MVWCEGSRSTRGAAFSATVAVLVACGQSTHAGHGTGFAGDARGGSAGVAGMAPSGGARGGKSGVGGAAGAGTGGSITVENAGEGGGCTRDVSLQAVVLEEPAPFDLVIVADNSASLSWSRDALSSGLSTLLANVKGRSARVFLLTPTQYGASSAAATVPLIGSYVVAWEDPASGTAYEGAVTNYVQVCTDPDDATDTPIACPDPKGPTAYKAHGRWDFVTPAPIAVITPDLTDAEFATEQQAVTNAILAFGGTGSPQEQPLCTLSRYLSQPAAALPENAVFVFITDEDDVSTPDDCLATYDAELTNQQQIASETACTNDCNLWLYSMDRQESWILDSFTCAAYTDDGHLIPGTEMMTNDEPGMNPANCDGFVEGPCTDAEMELAASGCNAGLSVESCTTACMTADVPCTAYLTSNSVDACTQPFSYLGQTYANLATYCATEGVTQASPCKVLPQHAEYASYPQGGYSHQNLMPGTTTQDLQAYVESKLRADFGAGKSLLEGILLEPGFSCQLGPGQSYAANLAAVVGDSTHLFPLCESYAPALDGVLGFAQALIQTTFTLSLQADEHVTAVVVLAKDGSKRTLPAADYTFDATKGVLSISPAALHATDASLSVEVTSDCRPNVR